MKHIALLPARLADEVGDLSVPIVTWEEVAKAYSIVGPPYWVGIIEVACESWETLVSGPTTFGANADAKLTGQQIIDQHQSDGLSYGYMGRRGGISGSALVADLVEGGWRDQLYEVRSEPLPNNPNWFAIPAFVEAVLRREPTTTAG